MNLFNKENDAPRELSCTKNFELSHKTRATTLKINCEGCPHKSSFSDQTCRKQIISKLVEHNADRVEFIRRLTTEEYEKDDVEKLKEISDIIVNVGGDFGLYDTGCGECAQKIRALQATVIDSLKKDPLNALRGLESPVTKENVHVKESCKKCANLRINKLSYIRKSLKDSKLAKHAQKQGDTYINSFTPKMRPFLSESRLVVDVPKNALPLCDEYIIQNAKVRLYSVPEWNEDLYFIIPPEYELRHEPKLLEILMQTKEWLLSNASEQIESTNSSKSAKHKFEKICRIQLLWYATQNQIELSEKETDKLVSILTRCTRGLDVIELLLRDPNVNDVYVNSPMETTPVYIKHKDHDDCRTNIYLTEERGNNFVLKFVLKSGIGLSPNSPILDMDLDDLKTRVNVIAPPLSPDGLAFALRCKNETPWTLPMFVGNKMISPLGAALLTTLVNDQVAMLVVGGRGTGKTSFLGGVMAAMNPKYRVLTIEDTLELPVPELNESGFRVQRMLARPITTNEGINISSDDALRSSLRMGESSIVVGEVRGQEAKVLYESIRVGATGNTVLGTIHGRSPRDVFERVVYDLRIPATSFKATDAVVVTERLPTGRRVTEIAELNKDVDIENLGSGNEANKLFNTLMKYDNITDEITVSAAFRPNKSQVLKLIADRRGVSPEKIWNEIETRAKMYEDVVRLSAETNTPKLLYLQASVNLNKKFNSLVEEDRRRDKGRYRGIRYDAIYSGWLASLNEYAEELGNNETA